MIVETRRVKASALQIGDVLRNGKVVSYRQALDASKTPGLTAMLKCRELVAIGFEGEPLPVLFTDMIHFIIDRPAEGFGG